MEITTFVRGIDRVADAMGLRAKPVESSGDFDQPGGGVDLSALIDSITPEMFAPRPIDYATEPLPQDGAYLTTNRAESSRGLPVLVKRDRAFGPGDLPGLSLYIAPQHAEAHGPILTAAGWSWYTDEAATESDR